MRNWVAVVVASLVMCGNVALVSASPTWKPYRSAEGGFAVMFPGEPELESGVTKTDLGAVEIHTVRCVTDDRMCVVKYYEAPSVTEKTRDKFLDDNCDGFVRGANLLQKGDRRAITLDGHPGREVVGETQDGRAQLTARYFVVGERVYLVMMATSVDDATSPDVARFFESFTLLESGQAPGA